MLTLHVIAATARPSRTVNSDLASSKVNVCFSAMLQPFVLLLLSSADVNCLGVGAAFLLDTGPGQEFARYLFAPTETPSEKHYRITVPTRGEGTRRDDDDADGDRDDVPIEDVNSEHRLTHVTSMPSGALPAGPLRAERPWAGGPELVASLEASTAASPSRSCGLIVECPFVALFTSSLLDKPSHKASKASQKIISRACKDQPSAHPTHQPVNQSPPTLERPRKRI
ncbi:hypothetical protein THAOC_23471 [Thalassiosira oceanica]|uniref:Uncharacterized protein n=1 Tax=Thalassiosira oceanica TaxID=159749 RepID=K0S6U1_THAOC|nr:hypothetical protein THAOC_23471 [Thalassiosira oceanica]|eukprot:EJK56606.1 hypothetical protein THAOC_23471 [Thalassiosira oceanica]